MLLSDLSPEQCSRIDSFKACHVPLPNQREVTEKVNRINFFKTPSTIRRGLNQKTKVRWTEDTLKYNLKGKRVMDSLPAIRDAESDFDPLYSSFSKNNQFIPPESSKEAQVKKKLASFMNHHPHTSNKGP